MKIAEQSTLAKPAAACSMGAPGGASHLVPNSGGLAAMELAEAMAASTSAVLTRPIVTAAARPGRMCAQA
jgi:hypothetical protein